MSMTLNEEIEGAEAEHRPVSCKFLVDEVSRNLARPHTPSRLPDTHAEDPVLASSHAPQTLASTSPGVWSLPVCSMGTDVAPAWPVRPLLHRMLRLQDALPSIPETAPMSTQSSPQKEVRHFSALIPKAALADSSRACCCTALMMNIPLLWALYEPLHSSSTETAVQAWVLFVCAAGACGWPDKLVCASADAHQRLVQEGGPQGRQEGPRLLQLLQLLQRLKPTRRGCAAHSTCWTAWQGDLERDARPWRATSVQAQRMSLHYQRSAGGVNCHAMQGGSLTDTSMEMRYTLQL